MLYFAGRDMTHMEITEHMENTFGKINPSDITQALNNRLSRDLSYVNVFYTNGNGCDAKPSPLYAVSKKAINTYFLRATTGSKAVGVIHLITIHRLVNMYMRMGKYCRIDLGNIGNGYPDILVLEPETCENGDKPIPSKDRWNEDGALAIEVETYPTKQAVHIYNAWLKDRRMNLNVRFVVLFKKDASTIQAILKSHDVGPASYTVTTIYRGVTIDGAVGGIANIPSPSDYIDKWLPECKPTGPGIYPGWYKKTGRKEYVINPDMQKKQEQKMGMHLTPLETAILHMLHFSNRDMTYDDIIKHMKGVFGRVRKTDITLALNNRLLLELKYININRVKSDYDDGNLPMRYSIASKPGETYLLHAAIGKRASSDLRLETIFQIAETQMRMGRHCQINMVSSLHDLVVAEPETYKYSGRIHRRPHRWNLHTALAVEVETNPIKHAKQIHKNWQQNHEMRYNVWFVVFDKNHADTILAILNSHGADPKSYTITTISKEDVINGKVDMTVDMPPQSDSPGKWLPECKPHGTASNENESKDVLKIMGRHDSNKPDAKTAQSGVKCPTPDATTEPECGAPSEPSPIATTDIHEYGINPPVELPVKVVDGTVNVVQAKPNRQPAESNDLAVSDMYHLSSLEYAIYNAVNEGLSVDPVKIRERISVNALESDIRKAVNGLHKKGLVATYLQTKSVRMKSLKGSGPKKTYYRERIMVKVGPVENPNTAVRQAKMIPGNKVDDTTRSKVATYSDEDLETMGRGRLNGLFRSDRITEKQKNKIMEILKARGLVSDSMGPHG